MAEPRSRPMPLWAFVKRVYAEFSQDRIPTVAGGITFFALLALFPAIGSVVSLYGMFSDTASIAHDVDRVSGFLPGGAVTILKAELSRLAAQPGKTLSLTLVGSSLVALWSASGGFKALVDGLNVAYEVREMRSFLRLSLNALVFTAASILFAAAAIYLSLIVPDGGQDGPDALALQILAWPASFAICSLVLAVVYRFGPNRRHPKWRWITWGSAVASLLWLVGTRLFTWYVANFGSYNRVYGDLGAAVGFLTWLWLSLVILLLGAEINCELEREDDGDPR
ncbi:MAG: YihY/virulence factor BrkB family protein [Alphaproteobacteria bacterium]|nr:YihY/virulence factor BrkB family protein [Alphaproteobacteria bacterium]